MLIKYSTLETHKYYYSFDPFTPNPNGFILNKILIRVMY